MISSCAETGKDDYKRITDKISALSNPIRLMIVESLKKKEKKYPRDEHPTWKFSMNSSEISEDLKKDFKIGPQGIGQHLKRLRKAGLVDRSRSFRDENGVGIANPVYDYYLKTDAFDDILLGLYSFRDRINSYVDDYKESKEAQEHGNCVITVLSGDDEGEKLVVEENQVAYIGRKVPTRNKDESPLLGLSENYESVSSIVRPHLTVYKDKGIWYMKDESSTNGTYCDSHQLTKGVAEEIPNNSLIKLSKGPGSVQLYFRYN